MIIIDTVRVLSLLAAGDAPPAIVYRAGFSVDADGAPSAYTPDDTGLDALANAGHPARWAKCDACGGAGGTAVLNEWTSCVECAGKGRVYEPAHWPGLVTVRGEPVIQGPTDPCPGAYVTETSLQNDRFAVTDPRRYVDASVIPYIAAPPQLYAGLGLKLGDLGMACLEVYDKPRGAPGRSLTGYKCGAGILAERGPHNRIGEGSIALAQSVGLSGNPRNGGLDRNQREVVWILFPGSGAQAPEGHAWPRTVASFTDQANALFLRFGGYARAEAALVDFSS